MARSVQSSAAACALVVAMVLLAGCADDSVSAPVSVAARVGWSVDFLSGAYCLPLPHSDQLGEVSAGAVGALAEDGAFGVEVSCSVHDNGAGFVVDATASTTDRKLHISIPALTGHPTRAMPVTGSASFRSQESDGEYVSPEAGCTFWFSTDTDERVEPGLLWATFECPVIVSGDSESECTIIDSYVVFDRCSG
jgi:hypothetical protein